MDNVEQKLGDKIANVVPGMTARPTTIAGATASLQKNIDDLNYVHELRQSNAESKAKQIEKLTAQKANDEKEAKGAKRMADKLKSFFFDDEDEVEDNAGSVPAQ